MKIFAVANNYDKGNKAVGDTLLRQDEPTIYSKADSSLLVNHKPFFIPDMLGPIGYGAHIVVRICRLGKSIPERFAHRYYDALTVGIDFTATQMLQEARSKGLPWDLSKSFDGAATIGEWLPKEKLLDTARTGFSLKVNGETVLDANTCSMTYGIDALIAFLSRSFTLKTGDLIFTGTPMSMRPASINDHIEGWIEEHKVLEFNCK